MESPADDGRGGGNRSQIHRKGKSCKGYLYYSSVLSSKSQNPRCVGISRTLQQVPNYIVEESEADLHKNGQQLEDFRYSCIGYSVYMDNKGASGDQHNKRAELPFCVGMEVLMNKKDVESAANRETVQKYNEDARNSPQPRIHKPAPAPAPSARDEFLNRFSRSASLVASGVVKNAKKVCNHVKSTIDDILYPYRRPPK
uniref:DUF8204 domain-containing protein n=1 Tax=Kalanchoe fedtschenkoi TaxID=63787 RepID=A0A7N0ZQT4_KALFE